MRSGTRRVLLDLLLCGLPAGLLVPLFYCHFRLVGELSSHMHAKDTPWVDTWILGVPLLALGQYLVTVTVVAWCGRPRGVPRE